MPVHELERNPTIRVLFNGLVISRVQDKAPIAQLGAVLGAECHEPKLTVTEVRADETRRVLPGFDSFKIKEDLFLDVTNTSRTEIETYETTEKFEAFKRSSESSDRHDFRLHLDFERDLFKDTPFDVSPSSIGPVFSIQNALFSTRIRSRSVVDTIPETGPETEIGFIAEVIEAGVTLDQLHSKAVLRTNNNVILTVNACDVVKGTTYLIEFDCECEVEPDGKDTVLRQDSDFKLVYSAIGANLDDSQKVNLKARKVLGGSLANPEVCCTAGNTKQSLK